MRIWNVVALVLAAGFMFAPLAQAQTDNDLRQEVEQLKRDLRKVLDQNARIASENIDMRDRVEGIEAADSTLEGRINALSESLNFAPSTTVNSVANPITIGGEFRNRHGWTFDRDFGRGNDRDDDGSFYDARYRVELTFEFDRNVVTHFSMQANGLFGNGDTPAGNGSGQQQFFKGSSSGTFASSSSGDLSDIDLYEGYIHLNNLFGRREFSVRAGRQEIVLGNEFIFGNNDFFSGETFDGTHWMWSSENFDLHFVFAKLATQGGNFNTRNHPYSLPGDGFDDDEVYSLYFTLKTIKDTDLDLYWVYFNGNNGGTAGTAGNSLGGGADFFFHTIGIRLAGMFNVAAGLDYNIEFSYQFGDIESGGGSDIDVDAFAVEAEIGITFNRNNNFRVFVRFLYAEGSDQSDEAAFIPLFGERHAQAGSGGTTNYRARYGLMDIIPLTNVLTVQGGLHFDPRADWTIGATFIYAALDEDVTIAGNSEDEIGFEIDVWAEYRYSDQTTMAFGVGLFFADEAAPLLGGGFAGDDDDLAFLFYGQVRVVF
ncbi:MAG: alginate export family protein [Planctomycetota bacterium]